MWTIMTTSIYVDLSCHSTIAVEVTDLRQPLGFPARFQNRSNRSPKERKKKSSMRLTSLATLRLYKEADMLGSHAHRSNQHSLFSRMPFPRFFPALLQPLILIVSPCTSPRVHVLNEKSRY